DLNANGVYEDTERMVPSHPQNGGVFVPWGAGGATQYDSSRPNLAVKIEETGPMRAVIRVEAPTLFVSTNNMTHGWAVRLYAYAGLPYVKIDYQLQNSAKNVKYSWPLYFESLHLDLRLNLGPDPIVRVGRADNSVWQRARGQGLCLAQIHHNRFKIYDKGTGDAVYDSGILANGTGAPGFLDVEDGQKGVMAAVRYWWQTWPNGLEIDGSNRLSVQLFPEWSCQWYQTQFADNGLYWLEDMQHVYKEVLLWFHPSGVRDAELVRIARTFEYHPVGTLPVAHYRDTQATFDLDGMVPRDTRSVSTDIRKPTYSSSAFNTNNVSQYNFGWDNFLLDISRKNAPSMAGGWSYSVSPYVATENPADYFRAEQFAIGELNVRPQWIAQYKHARDFNLIQPTENPYAGSSWRDHEGGSRPWLAAPYLPGTAPDVKPRDDQHGWFYHVEEAYYFTGNPWIRDWYEFVGEFRKVRLNQLDPWPDMCARAVGHALSHAMQAFRVTGDFEILRKFPEYVRKYLRPDQLALRHGGRERDASQDASFQMGYLARALISYLYEAREYDPQGYAEVFNFLAGCMAWNITYGNFAYYIKASAGQIGQSSGTGLTFVDPQAWWYWNTGRQEFKDHVMLFVTSGINGGSPTYGREYLEGWPYRTDYENYVGRQYRNLLVRTRPDSTPPARITDLKATYLGPAVTATWTRPADAVRYHFVYADKPIVATQTMDPAVCNWWAAKTIACTNLVFSGARAKLVFRPAPVTPCYVAVFSFDASNNMSEMSNCAQTEPFVAGTMYLAR
ncbi:MAG: hypothetical protein N2255_02745, partial [Kiritimatiellae bacterium]|nr:hypothetical protein [Kiritimatiellia bacterium]